MIYTKQKAVSQNRLSYSDNYIYKSVDKKTDFFIKPARKIDIDGTGFNTHKLRHENIRRQMDNFRNEEFKTISKWNKSSKYGTKKSVYQNCLKTVKSELSKINRR